jgi:hypothetical protein
VNKRFWNKELDKIEKESVTKLRRVRKLLEQADEFKKNAKLDKALNDFFS